MSVPDVPFAVTVSPEDPRLLFLSGGLDVATAPELRTRLAAALDQGSGDLVVDVATLEFIDSTGLGALVAAARRLQVDGGRLVVRNPRPPLLYMLELTSLDRVFLVEVPEA